MKKRIWAYLLTLVMVVGLLPTMAFAADEDDQSFQYDYDRDGDGIKDSWNISGPDNGENDVVFAYLTQNENTLTISGSGAMCGWEDKSAGRGGEDHRPWKDYTNAIKNIIIEDGVTTIGQNAFNRLVSCENVVFSDSITKIERNAFRQCSSLEKIMLPDHLETLGNNVFTSCYNVKQVDFGSGIKVITSCFLDMGQDDKIANQKLTSLMIPEQVNTIEGGFIRNCASLKEIIIKGDTVLANGNPHAFAAAALTIDATACEALELKGATEGVHADSVIYVSSSDAVDTSQLEEKHKPRCIFAITNGGTFSEETEFQVGAFAVPEKEGHRFLGWYTDPTDETTEVKAPEAGKTYYAKWEEKADYQITITPSVDSMKGKGTITLTVAVEPAEAAEFVEVSCDNGIDVTKNADGTYTAALPNKTQTYTFIATLAENDAYKKTSATCTVSVKKKSSSSSSGSDHSSTDTTEKFYTVSAADTESGKVKVEPAKAMEGDKVTVTVTPDKGFVIGKVKVIDADGNKIDLKDKGDGKYTFTMPDTKVEIKTIFDKIEEEMPTASEKRQLIVLTIDQKVASVFGELVMNDVSPILRNDRTMLPIRFVAEALGGIVVWNDSLNKVTITKEDVVIEIFIGSPFALVNGSPVELDASAFIENSRTYLPLRFVAENMGATVTWDATTKKVTILPTK